MKTKKKKNKVQVSIPELMLREETSSADGVKVDRENHIIRGVKILGRTSKNVHPESGKNYFYTDNALSGFASLQEGARVNIDHPAPGKEGLPRSYGDQIGEVRNVSVNLNEGEEGTYGDLHYNPAHPLAEQMAWDAENAPHRLALSHVAMGMGVESDEWHLIEEAKSVASVDIVSHGATNVSLFEGAPKVEKVEEPEGPSEEEIKMKEKLEKLTEENKELLARIGALETAAAIAGRRSARVASLKEANIDSELVSEKLMEHLVSVDDDAAAVIIEGLKGASENQTPVSRDSGTPNVELTGESFLSALEG